MQLKDLKTSLFGFNKNDVCEYISQLNAEYEQKQEQIKKEQSNTLAELNQKNEELNNTVSSLSQENTELIREKESLQKRVSAFDGEIEKFKEQITQMREMLNSVFQNVNERFDLFENQIGGLSGNEQSGETEDEKE